MALTSLHGGKVPFTKPPMQREINWSYETPFICLSKQKLKKFFQDFFTKLLHLLFLHAIIRHMTNYESEIYYAKTDKNVWSALRREQGAYSENA